MYSGLLRGGYFSNGEKTESQGRDSILRVCALSRSKKLFTAGLPKSKPLLRHKSAEVIRAITFGKNAKSGHRLLLILLLYGRMD